MLIGFGDLVGSGNICGDYYCFVWIIVKVCQVGGYVFMFLEQYGYQWSGDSCLQVIRMQGLYQSNIGNWGNCYFVVIDMSIGKLVVEIEQSVVYKIFLGKF